eukprot:jgi/Botrbrau1/22754/Bobra.0132s0086.1
MLSFQTKFLAVFTRLVCVLKTYPQHVRTSAEIRNCSPHKVFKGPSDRVEKSQISASSASETRTSYLG